MKKINTILSQIKIFVKRILFKNYLENPENIQVIPLDLAIKIYNDK